MFLKKGDEFVVNIIKWLKKRLLCLTAIFVTPKQVTKLVENTTFETTPRIKIALKQYTGRV